MEGVHGSNASVKRQTRPAQKPLCRSLASLTRSLSTLHTRCEPADHQNGTSRAPRLPGSLKCLMQPVKASSCGPWWVSRHTISSLPPRLANAAVRCEVCNSAGRPAPSLYGVAVHRVYFQAKALPWFPCSCQFNTLCRCGFYEKDQQSTVALSDLLGPPG